MEHTREIDTTATTRRMRPPRARAKPVNDEPGVKYCPKCETRLPVDAFGVARERLDGLTGWCRSCRAERTRARRVENPEAAREQTNKAYRTSPDRWFAKNAVARAIENGQIPRPAPGTLCRCGKDSPLEAHHHLGHEKEHWLDIVWCCRSCRTLADAQSRPRRRVLTHSMLAAMIGAPK